MSGIERELELERRKHRELQELSRGKDKEYQKLKVGVLSVISEFEDARITFMQNQYDKIKRKALLGATMAGFPSSEPGYGPSALSHTTANDRSLLDPQSAYNFTDFGVGQVDISLHVFG
jgi:hypothetical protein